MRAKYIGILLVAGIVVSATSASLNAQQLSPEGEARRAAHEFMLGEYAEDKELKIRGDILEEIVISRERQEFSGDVLIDLPEGTQRVMGKFRYLVLRGEGLDNLEGLALIPYSEDSNMPVSTVEPGLYRTKVVSMPVPSDSLPQAQLKSRCREGATVVITEIALNSQNKLNVEFDDIPYRNLGAEFPCEVVDVFIDAQHELSIDGHVDLEREKFCRYYAAPGNLHSSFEAWAAERNFLPGRQMTKLQPALVERYSNPRLPSLGEDEATPGAADLSFFDGYDGAMNETIAPFREIDFAMCFNDYPEFMSIKQVGRGTPLIEHFDDAAELAAAFIENQLNDGGRTATWWEVKNESTIKAEWDYHWQAEYDSWALMADFHNKVADAVHERTPDVMVGGPSSAWMQVQVNDFDLYRNQLKFMDLTRGRVDFYSHHFYENIGSLGAWERREGAYTNYLLGRMEAILDMFRAHMHGTDNVRPILITECGSLQPGRGPSDYWLRLRSWSAYMHKMMQRPEQIDLGVPFAFMSIPWNPRSGDAAFIPKEGMRPNSGLSDCEPTPVHYFFEFWRDFDGRRLPVEYNREFLDITAVHSGNRVQLAVTNMGGRRLSLNVASIVGELPCRSVEQRRLYYLDGQIVFEDTVEHPDASSIPVDVEETTIVTLVLNSPLTPEAVVNRRCFYAAETAVKSDAAPEAGFAIGIEELDSVANATLRIGVQREGGLGGPLSGTINGRPFSIEAGWANEHNHLFATIGTEIEADILGETNHIKIDQREGLTITSVQLVTDHH